jgi:glyoxylase-like metal-dependent hydrolase (beta-lactamase superfamily II)
MPIRKLVLALLAVLGGTALTPATPNGFAVIPGTFEPSRQPDGNTVVFDAPDGLVVLDTGRHPEHSRKILDFATKAGKPIVAVINSHWHLDHVSGNPRLRARYPELKVYASDAIDGAMHGFLANSKKQATAMLGNAEFPESMKAEIRADIATIDSGKAIYPDVVVSQSGEVDIGGRKLQLGLAHAATRGDVWVYDAANRLLATGDLVTLPVPFLDTACAAGWSKELERLDGLDFERFVPGHGHGMSHEQFATYRRGFDALVACANSGADKKVCAEGWLRDAGELMDESERANVDGMLGYYVDVLRDPAKRKELCD